MSQLTFVCQNCNACLAKPEILNHNCIIVNASTLNGEEDELNNALCNSETENNTGAPVKINNQKAMHQKCWNEFCSEVIEKYETNDEKLKIILNCLKSRTNMPRKEHRFYNYINAFPLSKHVSDCAKIIWDIISSHEGFHLFKDKPSTVNSDTSENPNRFAKKRKNQNVNNECPEPKRSLIDDKPDDIVKGDSEKKTWDDLVAERLANFQTTDENLKIVIDRIKGRRHLPQKENKFANLVSTIPQSRTVENCTKILWDIINPNEAPDLVNKSISDTELATVSNGQSQKRELHQKQALNQNKWYENAIELLNRHHTDDINLQSIINVMKTRKNLPRKMNKFINFINAMSLSKKVPNCAQVIWDIISASLVNVNQIDAAIGEESVVENVIKDELTEITEKQEPPMTAADQATVPCDTDNRATSNIDRQDTPMVDEFENY